jgi:hypothetical protein
MSKAKVDFASLPWEEPATGVRSKAVTRDGKKLRLVEFTSEFVEQDWCLERSHWIRLGWRVGNNLFRLDRKIYVR